MGMEDLIDKEALKQMGVIQGMGVNPLEGMESKKQIEMVNTFLGELPKDPNVIIPWKDPKFIHHIINEVASNLTPMGEISAIAKGGKDIYSLGEKGAKAAKEYLDVGKKSEKFIKELGEGAETVEQNIAKLSEKMKPIVALKKEEALIPKKEVMGEVGKENIFTYGPKELPNAAKIAQVFEKDVANITEQQSKALQKELEKYYKHGDVEKLVTKGEKIFGHEGLSEKEISKIESLLPWGRPKESAYLSKPNLTKYYDEGLKEYHQAFERNRSFMTADKLISELKKEQRMLISRQKAKTLDTRGDAKLSAISKNIDNLIKDMEKFTNELPIHLQGKYQEFLNKWREGVSHFESSETTSALSRGEPSGVKPSEIASTFAHPDKNILKIIRDMGDPLKKHIVANELLKLDPKNAKKIAQTILDMKKHKGYEHYITPEMEKWAKDMLKHVKRATLIKEGIGSSLGATALGLFTGSPYGAIVGAALPMGRKPLVNMYEALKRKF